MNRGGRRPTQLDLERGESHEEGVPTPRRSARLAAQTGTPRDPPSGGRLRAQPDTPRPSASPGLQSGVRFVPDRNASNLATPPASHARTTPEAVVAESVPPPPSSSPSGSSGSSNVTTVQVPESGIQGSERSGDEDPCPICYESLAGRIMSCRQCNKDFHAECIYAWETRMGGAADTCPHCRTRRGYDYRDYEPRSTSPERSPDRMSIDSVAVNRQEARQGQEEENDSTRRRGQAQNSRQPRRSARRPNNIPGRRQAIPVAPQEAHPRPVESASSSSTSQPITPGLTRDGKQICYARSGRAIVKDESGNLSLYTPAEAGGTTVIDSAIALDSVKNIETQGWKELKANWRNLGPAFIAWAVPGAWDPYSQRLPEIMCCVVYHQEGQRIERVGSRTNAKLLFGNATGDAMIAESLHAGSLDPMDALEQLYGVTHQERIDYWRDHPRYPGSSRGSPS